LVAGATPDIQHRCGRFREVFEELLMHHIGAHVPLYRGIGFIDERVGQIGPGILCHALTMSPTPGWTQPACHKTTEVPLIKPANS
jgi:hypothetical protein